MRPWVIWLIKHRMAWLLKSLVVMSLPVHLLTYLPEVIDDIKRTLREIELEEKK